MVAAHRKKVVDHEGQGSLFSWIDRTAGPRDATELDPRGPAQGLLLTVLAMMGFGLLIQASHAATAMAPEAFDAALTGQVGMRLAGLALLWAASHLGPAGVRRFLPHAFVLCIALLVAVYLPGLGANLNGARRWVRFGPLSFQPSELARIVLVLWVASHCVLFGDRLSQLRRALLPMLAWIALFFLLVFFEKDMGGSLLLGICAVATLWLGGARFGHITPILLTGVASALVYGLFNSPHVRHRFLVWLGRAENDQVSETMTALGAGGWIGEGFTQGQARIQSVSYLESDFVLAQVGEEFGFIGMGVMILLFGVFTWHALRLVLRLPDRFEALAAFGLLLSVALQGLIHIQVTAGISPAKGMTLPFVSDGGSSLLVSCIAVGLALGAARHGSQPESLGSPEAAGAAEDGSSDPGVTSASVPQGTFA